MFKTAFGLAGALLTLGVLPTPALADHDSPLLAGEAVIELQNDNTYDSDDPDAELNDLSTLTEVDLNLLFNPEIRLNTHFTLEAIEDSNLRDDRYFKGHGVFAENITLNYATDDFVLYAGKFSPTFSIAFDGAALGALEFSASGAKS